MLFKKIEMHGFKSFAEPITIEFNRGITGIVGPNGSGKSNISDAIRWVLGEQSPKMLRGGKMEEVIFNGTDSRKSRGMAEVTLVIDNSDDSLPIDYKEVAITRRMFRSGESEYHINGNQCRLRDIRELIMDTGIGVDGYSIIGQGKISDIISNKTESRREIFEEAAGIVTYRNKKAEAERKLASASLNLERIQDIIGELGGRIGGLEEDSIKAKEFLELRDRHKELEINIVLKNVESLELKNSYAAEDLRVVEENIKRTEEEKEILEKELNQASGRNEALEAISLEAREKLLESIDKLNETVNRAQVDRERLQAIETNLQRLQSEILQLEEKSEREKKNWEGFAEEKNKIDSEAAHAQEVLEDHIEIYESHSAYLTELMAEADRCKDEIYRLSSQNNASRSEIGSMVRMRETLAKRKEELLAEKELGEDSNRDTLDSLNTARREREDIAYELEDMRGTVGTIRASLGQDQIRERELTREIEELKISLGRMAARKKTIEEMESNYEGYNYAVKHIMKSSLKGIHGVVAELISVPKGYETAIETALGQSLQNIVCEDDDAAKAAIRSLKENRAGRMTFLPLKSIKGRNLPDPAIAEEPGFAGFGPKCVNYDSRYREIIHYLLGGVVIARDMDSAVRISKRHRGVLVVTLEGEIINARGAITGGKYKNKTANILDRKAELSQLGRDIEEGQKRRDDEAIQLERLRETMERNSSQLIKLEESIRERERQLMLKEKEIELGEHALKDIKTSGDKMDRELDSISREDENTVAMIQKTEEAIREREERIELAQTTCESKLEEHEKKKDEFDRLSEEITKARITVTSCDERKAHAEDLLNRINRTIEEIGSEKEEKSEQIKALEEEKRSLTSSDGNYEDRVKSREEERDAAQSKLDMVTEEKSALTASLSRLNSDRDQLSQKLQTFRDQKYDLDIRKAKSETQLDTYKEKLWEDFEVSYIQALEFKSEDFVLSKAIKENRQIKNRIKELGEVNIGAIEEYEIVKERYEFLTEEEGDLVKTRDNLNSIISDTDRVIRRKFKESFDKIVINFEKQFKELFGGGHAELRLSDMENPLESAIDIVAQPPGKKLQNINLLSGGEKTLTAIALMFAVLKSKPTPFCILDEVEAALDDANIERFIRCLRQFNDIQFTLVTHQKSTMEHADVLYGVTMPEKGVSKVLSLSFEEDLSRYSS